MNVLCGEVRSRVEAEVKRMSEQLEGWHKHLAAHAVALGCEQLTEAAYAIEVEHWRKRVRGEVRSLHLKSAAAACGGRLRNESMEDVAARLNEPLKMVDELARAWLEKPPSSTYPLMVVRGGVSVQSVLWGALETFDVLRNTQQQRPSGVWNESQHPRDADGRFSQTGAASRPSTTIINPAKVGKRFANLDPLPELSEHDPFEPIYENIHQAEARLRIVGVQEAKLGSDLRVASATVRVIEETARLTGRVPDRVVIDTGPFEGTPDDAYHVYDPITRTHTILVNPSAKIFTRAGKFATYYAQSLYKSKWFSTENPYHVITHEMGHMLHAENSPTLFLQWHNKVFTAQMQQDFKGLWPSKYAKENPYEFVAEVYSMKIKGKSVHPIVQKWYKELGGWEP